VLLAMDQKEKDYLQDLTEIRSMMEKSSRFISLSGLAGVFAGVFALAGSISAYYILKNFYIAIWYENDIIQLSKDLVLHLFLVAMGVLFLSLFFGYYFTTKKAKKLGHKTWNKTSQLMLINLAIPLFAGGIFCVSLFLHGNLGLIAPTTLIFYGLALVNGSKFTLNDIKYLGYCEMIVGLIATFFIGWGLWFWAFGFGILHIVYGISMYYKYEHKQ
jgi:hypothetical protein